VNDFSKAPAIDDARLLALRRKFSASAARYDAQGCFPDANIEELHRAGLLALTVPRRYGGSGAGLREASRALGVIAEGCASTALILAMQVFQQATLARSELWPEPVRARLATEAVADGALMNALRVEPALGSPSRGGLPATIVRRGDRGWILTGHKVFSTGAPGLRWLNVWARTDEEPARVGYVLVRGDASGIRIAETWDHLGIRATCSHDVIFTGVPVEEAHIAVRPQSDWRRPDATQMAWNAAGISAIYTGVARAARDWVADFLCHRVPTGLGAPLATLLRAQEKVGEMEMLLSANARLIASVAADTDAGSPPDAGESALIKAMVVENAIRAVDLAASLAGNHAHARANAIERHIRDVRSGRIQAPQADAAFVISGREVLLSGT
jgi:alkylation response protein AidB-like acyl-CoA dehydrogenase